MQGDVGMGSVPFHIRWPLGVRKARSAAREEEHDGHEKWVFMDRG